MRRHPDGDKSRRQAIEYNSAHSRAAGASRFFHPYEVLHVVCDEQWADTSQYEKQGDNNNQNGHFVSLMPRSIGDPCDLRLHLEDDCWSCLMLIYFSREVREAVVCVSVTLHGQASAPVAFDIDCLGVQDLAGWKFCS